MTAQTPTTEATPKRKQQQPLHHAGKSRQASAARRKKIVKDIIAGKPLKQAGIDAGLSPKSADSQVSQILNEPKVKNSLLAAMAAIGLDDACFAKHHKLLLEGTRFLPSRGDESGPYIEVPDLAAKAKALELAFKLTGRFIEKHEVDVKPPVKIIIKKFCSRTNQNGIFPTGNK